MSGIIKEFQRPFRTLRRRVVQGNKDRSKDAHTVHLPYFSAPRKPIRLYRRSRRSIRRSLSLISCNATVEKDIRLLCSTISGSPSAERTLGTLKQIRIISPRGEGRKSFSSLRYRTRFLLRSQANLRGM